MTRVTGYVAAGNMDRDELILKYVPLVKRIAYHFAGRLPKSVQSEDLIQAGMVGLLEAARNYDPGQGAAFETYATIRIRGAILDDLRKSDWTPRSVYRKTRKISEAIREIEHHTGRNASDKEIADAVGMSLEEYYHTLQDTSNCRVFSFDEIGDYQGEIEFDVPDAAPTPEEVFQTQAFRQALVEAIRTLPERESMVLSLYYDKELNLREIGAVLGVTESRVCQIHSQAVLRLRSHLAEWLSRQSDAKK